MSATGILAGFGGWPAGNLMSMLESLRSRGNSLSFPYVGPLALNLRTGGNLMSSRKSMVLALSVLALVSSGLYVGQPAQANDFERFLNFLRGDRRNQAEVDGLIARVSDRLEQGRAEGRLTGREYRRLQ